MKNEQNPIMTAKLTSFQFLNKKLHFFLLFHL